MHILNRFINRKTSGAIDSFREESHRKHERLYVATALASLVLALAFAFHLGKVPFLLLFAMSALGILYNATIFPDGRRFRSLKDLPGSKNIAMALAWAFVAAELPRVASTLSLSPAAVTAFSFTFSMVFIRSVMSDTLDIQSDRLLGRETIPMLIGEARSRNLLLGISMVTFVFLALSYPLGWTGTLSFFLLSCPIYVWICFYICDKRSTSSGVIREGLWETIYIIAGVSALAWLIIAGRSV
jgi:4-hydroxy-3-methylbut-2-enyl diphosphate reductase